MLQNCGLACVTHLQLILCTLARSLQMKKRQKEKVPSMQHVKQQEVAEPAWQNQTHLAPRGVRLGPLPERGHALGHRPRLRLLPARLRRRPRVQGGQLEAGAGRSGHTRPAGDETEGDAQHNSRRIDISISSLVKAEVSELRSEQWPLTPGSRSQWSVCLLGGTVPCLLTQEIPFEKQLNKKTHCCILGNMTETERLGLCFFQIRRESLVSFHSSFHLYRLHTFNDYYFFL